MIIAVIRTCIWMFIVSSVLWTMYGVVWVLMTLWPITAGVTFGALVVVGFIAWREING